MRTLIVYTNYESLPEFAIVDGDKRHLDGMIGNCNNGEQEQYNDEFFELIETSEFIDKFPMRSDMTPDKDFDYVIRIGWAP